MILVEETQLFGNFLDTRVSKVEQLTGSLYFQLVEIVQRGTTRVAQEELPEMGGGIVGAAGNVVEGEPFAQMTAHVGDGRLCKIGVPGALDGAELHDVSVGSQQMPQAGTGITQVVGAVACFQIQEDFLKKGEALLQPGLGGFGNFEDVVEHGAEHVALLTRKVNPINAPRVGARCGIGMRHAGFEQEELPFLHVLPATVNAEPAFAVNTMDNWVLLAEIFPNHVRGAAMAVCTAALWIASFLLTYTFPFLNAGLGTGGTFLLYAFICLSGFIFTLRRIPETKGKSLEELENELTR